MPQKKTSKLSCISITPVYMNKRQRCILYTIAIWLLRQVCLLAVFASFAEMDRSCEQLVVDGNVVTDYVYRAIGHFLWWQYSNEASIKEVSWSSRAASHIPVSPQFSNCFMLFTLLQNTDYIYMHKMFRYNYTSMFAHVTAQWPY